MIKIQLLDSRVGKHCFVAFQLGSSLLCSMTTSFTRFYYTLIMFYVPIHLPDYWVYWVYWVLSHFKWVLVYCILLLLGLLGFLRSNVCGLNL